MTTLTMETFTTLQLAEDKLLAALNNKESDPRETGVCLVRYRNECDKVIVDDLLRAREHNGEQALWHLHVRIQKRFKRALQACDGGKKPVEYRKMAKSYLDFIKDGQLYYRGFIQRLVSKYGRIPELDAVASNLWMDVTPASSTKRLSKGMRHAVLLSCHEALIYLGDLSRYREEVLTKGEFNWSPAIGYYDLAGAIHPTSGASHHQLAVIARHGGGHLRVTYHFYRALATEEPYPNARANLELELKKVESAHSKGNLLNGESNGPRQKPEMVSIGLFMLLHSRLYRGVERSDDDALENEALAQLEIDLKQQSIGAVLNKLVVINVAAQYYAGVKFQKEPHAEEDMRAFDLFLRFNIKTFITLLHSLQSELSQPKDGQSSSGLNQSRITATTRRILPVLRHYSSWLISNINVLTGYITLSGFGDLINIFFSIYASTMTVLAHSFNPNYLPSIEYLLEEDEDTIAFKPLDDQARSRYYDQTSGTLKQKFHTHGLERYHPNVEMLGRIRDLLADAVALATRDDVPVDLVGVSAFAFRGDTVPTDVALNTNGYQKANATSTGIQNILAPTKCKVPFDALAYLEDHISEHMSRASSSSASIADTAMENMVQNLVETSKLVNERNPMPENATPYPPRPRLSTHGFTYSPPPPPLPDYGPIGTPPKVPAKDGSNASIGSPAEPSSNSKNIDFGPIGTPPRTTATGNDTSYGVIGTPTAQELARRLSGQSSNDTSPRPRLPSTSKSPFGTQADGATTSFQQQRQSQQGSQQGLPQASHTNGHHVISSSISTLQDPSSLASMRAYITHSPRNEPNIWSHERGAGVRRGLSWGVDASPFMSSNILSGSTWNGSQQVAAFQTPPNGQGTA